MKHTRLVTIIFSMLLCSCNNTVGIIELKGKVLDESTKAPIPNLSIMVEALDQSTDENINRYVGEFTTDSSGCFTYTLNKVKNNSLYNFSIQSNQTYAESNNILGLSDLETDGRFLSFQMKRIVDLTFKIDRVSKTTLRDTLTVSWKTDGVDGKIFYPYIIENYRINSENRLLWIGGKVKSEVRTKVYAEKYTIVHWELSRNGKHTDIIDTIYCIRDASNNVYLNY